MIVLLDNYDSFVHNLARYLERLGQATRVVRSDAVTVAEVAAWNPAALVISPGPGGPADAGCSVEAVRRLGPRLPILGVCLGHQAIGAACGARVVRAPEPVHGRASLVAHAGEDLFTGLPSPLRVGRYHSLVVEAASLPAELQPTARCEDGLVMALAHRDWPVWGVQFHPESVLTEHGYELLANFLRLAGLSPPRRLPSGASEFPPPADPPDDAGLPAAKPPRAALTF